VRTLAVRRLTDNAVADRAPAWSADGAFVVYSSDTASDGSYDLYRIDVNGNNAELLYDAAPGQRASDAVFTPDGRYMLFTLGSARDAASWEIMRLELATGDVTALTQNTHKDWRPAPTSGGDVLFLTERAGGEIARGYAAVARIGIDGGDVEIVYDGDGYESSAQFSPDETLLIFTSDVSGRDEVYARVLDGASDPVQVTTEGGFGAVWLAE
jgi:Tol biopolymer transport system component